MCVGWVGGGGSYDNHDDHNHHHHHNDRLHYDFLPHHHIGAYDDGRHHDYRCPDYDIRSNNHPLSDQHDNAADNHLLSIPDSPTATDHQHHISTNLDDHLVYQPWGAAHNDTIHYLCGNLRIRVVGRSRGRGGDYGK